MIPKKIHYCWFGKNKKPLLARKCIRSWKKYLKGFEIIEWNEENYDLSSAPLYVRQAYEAHKWAFVSDYVRLDVLNKYGGVYFDTDVELIKPIEDILSIGAFMACEIDGDDTLGVCIRVASGLGMATEANSELIHVILSTYDNDRFILSDGSFNLFTIVSRTTDILTKFGLKNSNLVQKVGDFSIYPAEYFCPIDMNTGNFYKTANTKAIHWFDASWMKSDSSNDLKRFIHTRIRKLFGNRYRKIRSFFLK